MPWRRHVEVFRANFSLTEKWWHQHQIHWSEKHSFVWVDVSAIYQAKISLDLSIWASPHKGRTLPFFLFSSDGRSAQRNTHQNILFVLSAWQSFFPFYLPQLGKSLKCAPSCLVAGFFAILFKCCMRNPSFPSIFPNLVKVGEVWNLPPHISWTTQQHCRNLV